MSIEDLDYLYQNSVKENIIILVDSAKRNREYWLEPNEFQIDFVDPFKYVYGVEILDLNIPRTVYGVDDDNNTLIFYIMSQSGVYEKQTIVLESRDYTISELIENINADLIDLNTTVTCKISMDSAVDENRKSILEFGSQSTYPFYIDIHASTMGSTLGFDSVSQSIYTDQYAHLPSTSAFKFGNVDSGDTRGVRVDITNKYVFGAKMVSSTSYTRTLAISHAAGEGDGAHTYPYAFDSIATDTVLPAEHFIARIEVLPNTVKTIRLIAFDGDDVHMEYPITLERSGESSVFELDTNNPAHIFYAPFVNNTSAYAWSIITDVPLTRATLNMMSANELKLISPGIVTLLGDRFVTIHCDEIENHLKGSMMFNTYSPGLAMVNLGVLGYSQTRNDFYSVNYKEFHPIGKLTNLKFSVRNPLGKLYNFRNVNWHMLICVKFFVPKQKKLFTKSTLNPNYDLNYVQYQISKDGIRTKELQDDSEDSDDEEVDGNPFQFRYQLSKREEALRRQFEKHQNEESDSSDDSDE